MSCRLDYSKELTWERSFLKKKCKQVGVEHEFHKYQMRLRANYIGVFIVLHLGFIAFHSTLLLMTCEPNDPIYIDVSVYLISVVAISATLWVNFYEDFVLKHFYLTYLTSILVVICFVAVDVSLCIYHDYINWETTSLFDTYLLLTIYVFLPIPHILPPMGLGCFATLSYVIYHIVNHRLRRNYIYISTNIVHHICLNLLGTFFRIMRDILVRSSFLDRHQYFMEDISIRNARKQEKAFLHTILPMQIAQPIEYDIRSRIKYSEKHRDQVLPNRRERIMAIQIHPDVSILYADVVNYTHLTTTLSVNNLVALLHEIYARFDNAANRFMVQRIKFLGDCYYCVAGMITPDPDHAKRCVELGLCMIDNIREVRAKQNVDIDIRVGVHSGKVFAGVIGTAKLQYDIWGKDVIIANHLEATGVPSHLHVSERTHQMIIDYEFEVHPGTQAALEDPYLVKHNINTFLIRSNAHAHKSINFDIDKLESINTISSLMVIKEQKQTIEQELAAEFKNMPVGPSGICRNIKMLLRFGAAKGQKHTHPAIGYYMMHFHDPRLESSYINQPDYLLKYSILLAWIICLSLVYTQMVFVSGFVPLAPHLSTLFIVSFTMLLIVAWYKKLCIWRYSSRPHRYSLFSCYLFRMGENIQSSLVKRMAVYLYTITVYFAIVSIMLMDCDKPAFQLVQIESKLYHYEPEYSMCFPPWVLTTMMSLIISMSLIFTRIPIMMKVIVSTLAAITYLIVVFFQFEINMHHTYTTNPYLPPEYCHCEFVVIILLKLYFKERQTEFNNKINYKWRVELLKKQHDAHIADQSISVLLHNILPSHVVNVYLNALAKHEHYYENYEMVAVMFASLKNFQLDLPNLRILNEIISEFDRILTFYSDDYVVEKIKIVGCTYMAACGLDVRFSKVYVDPKSPHASVIREVMRARRSLVRLNQNSRMKRNRDEVVFVLTTFALDLMRTLWVCNNDYRNMSIYREIFDTNMSIGISSGEVMAGVVGASQVHYDIWGNAVNMASRMDSTGVAGKIQVTEETAKILTDYGLECNYRGMTYIKGRGTLPTYFVDIDENHEFKYSRMSSMDTGNRTYSSDASSKI